MNVYSMTPEQIQRAIKIASEIATEIGADEPDAARLILDGVELGLKEMLVHLFKGDRETAEKVHRQINAKDMT